MKILIGWIAQFVGHYGGMDKVFVNFSNEMTRRGHQVTMVYCTEKQEKSCFAIDPAVNVINLVDLKQDHVFESYKKTIIFKVKREFFRIINSEKFKNVLTQYMEKQIGEAVEVLFQKEQPDIIITLDHKTTKIFQLYKKINQIPIITMSHFDAKSILKCSSSMEKEAVANCDMLQVLMPHDIDIFKNEFPLLPIKWIPNVVPQYIDCKVLLKEPVIIDMARFDKKQKRQHLLLEAFAKISEQFPQWKVELWGEEQSGATYTRKLQEIIQKHHLENQVKLCGNTDDVLSVYRRASILAFPSAYEGFPLAMTEAMSAGLPVVAYRSCPAVNELVRNGETGLLVDDGVDALAEGLKKLMEDQELRERMGKAAHESMKEFAPKKIWDQWESLMQDVIAKHKAKIEH